MESNVVRDNDRKLGGIEMTTSELKIKIFADGAEKSKMLDLYRQPHIKGFTTNPTLMRQAGITDYEGFAKDILESIPDRPISFEVFSDEFLEMRRQAMQIAAWGPNVYVKIPITNTKGESAVDLIADLAQAGVKVNVTAMMTMQQVQSVKAVLANGPACYVSVFAGRIADAGIDPIPVMRAVVEEIRPYSNMELIWASPRELLNLVQADEIGCHVITVTPEILKKLNTLGKDLTDFSLDTVQMFYRDATAAGFNLAPPKKPVEPLREVAAASAR
jgi:transaldolase